MCWQTTVTTRCGNCNYLLKEIKFVDKCLNAEGDECKDGAFKRLVQDPKGERGDCRRMREDRELAEKKAVFAELRMYGLLGLLRGY